MSCYPINYKTAELLANLNIAYSFQVNYWSDLYIINVANFWSVDDVKKLKLFLFGILERKAPGTLHSRNVGITFESVATGSFLFPQI